MAIVAIFGMFSCESDWTDVVTTVNNYGQQEGLITSMDVLPMYVDAIAEAQGAEKVSSNSVVLRHQSDESKAKQGAIAGANKVKAQILAKKTLEIDDPTEGRVFVSVVEGTKEDSNMQITVTLNSGECLAHYYKVTTDF